MAAGATHVVAHARRRDDDGDSRVAVVAGRRVGKAVVRNRAKRRLRACLRQIDLPRGLDLVVTAKAGADTVPVAVLSEELTTSVAGATRRARRR
jgi:ribonuclease P protein component